MKHFLYSTLLISLLLSACGSLPGLQPTATATSTPLPTDTPEPTFTLTPTHTPTPTATSTPDIPATQAVQATHIAEDVLAELDKSLGEDSDIPYADGHLLWQQSDEFLLKMTGPDEGFLPIDDTITAGDFIFKADATWEATGLLVCGFVFRSEPNLENGKQYMFQYLRFSGLPAWEISVNQYGRHLNTISDFRTSSALDLANGATNQLIIVAQDNEFTVYINFTRQGRYYDNSKQRGTGVFGFYGWQDSGKGMCEFENAWIWSLDK